MRKMKTKKEIEFAYDYAMEQMHLYNDLACKEESESFKEYYIKMSVDYSKEACIYGWVLGKEDY